MSKTIKRNVLIVLFAVVATFSLAFSFVFKSAKAEENTPTVSTELGQAEGVVMLKGAAARLTQYTFGDTTYNDGLRAIVTVTDHVKNSLSETTTLQVWFTTAENFETAKLYPVEALLENSRVCTFTADDLYKLEGETLWYGNAVLANLSAKNQQDYQFVAIGVLSTTTDGTTTYTLGSFAESDVEKNTRSLYERVNAAFLNSDAECNAILSNNTYASWYGTENYPILVETEDDYNALTARAVKNNIASLKAATTALDSKPATETAPAVTKLVTVTVNANGTTTKFLVAEGSNVSERLTALKPNDTDTHYFVKWDNDGTEINADTTITATMAEWNVVTVQDSANTTIKVKDGTNITDALSTLTVNDTEDQYWDGNWTFEGADGDSITNVNANATVKPTMLNFYKIQLIDSYATGDDKDAVLGTLKIKQGQTLGEANLVDTIKDTAFAESDETYYGYQVTINGVSTYVEDVDSNLDSVVITGDATISLYYLSMQEITVNVYVESYGWKTGSAQSIQFENGGLRYDTAGVNWDKVNGSYVTYPDVDQHTYINKTTEFVDLTKVQATGKSVITGYPQDYIDLTNVLKNLPAEYTLNTTKAGYTITPTDGTYVTDQKIVEGENVINVYLDANTEKLGFALTDVYYVLNGKSIDTASPATLTRLSDGKVGVYLERATNLYNQWVGVLTDLAHPNADYDTVITYGFKSLKKNDTTHVYASADFYSPRSAKYKDGCCFEVDESGNWKFAKSNIGSGYKAVDNWYYPEQFNNVNLYFNGGTENSAFFIQSLSYPKSLQTTKDTTYNAKELVDFTSIAGQSGTIAMAQDKDGNDVLRYTRKATETAGTWFGVQIAFGTVDLTKYEHIYVKVQATGTDTGFRWELNGGIAGINGYTGMEYVVDLLDMKVDDGGGLRPMGATDKIIGSWSNDTYTTWKSSGTMSNLILRQQVAGVKDFSIDIYSVQFVVKTAAENPEA